MSAETAKLFKHALGIHLDTDYPYRNYYCAVIDDSTMENLVALGLLKRGKIINEGRNRYYHVTTLGADSIGAYLPNDLQFEEMISKAWWDELKKYLESEIKSSSARNKELPEMAAVFNIIIASSQASLAVMQEIESRKKE